MKASTLAICVIGLLVLLSVASCVPMFQPFEVTGLSVHIQDSHAGGVDVDAVLSVAQSEVRRTLPNAYLNILSFVGTCDGLAQLHGVMNLGFFERRLMFLRWRTLHGGAHVNTVDQTMDLRFADHTPYYPVATSLTLGDGLAVKEITALANEHIASLDVGSCDVLLRRFGDRWSIECTDAGSGPLGPRKCAFEVDPFTGQIDP